ncbi:MAG TPA: type II secretion system protein [Tepidisphaeraceae bacterium]|jgi:prepilin-type N-terminal cleavage/methylation domain-containing protein|nr:type II secretion system protein [Tepidisphaeraceae bacterium]
MMRCVVRRARGFTVIELMVTMTIIVVLMSMLIPAVGKVRGMSMATQCQSNIHQLMTAFLAFSVDHDNCLPGCINNDGPGYQTYQYDWLSQSGIAGAPQTGTIWPYINTYQVYRCPAMDTDLGSSADRTDFASNGHFDYGFFAIFAGSNLATVPKQSTLYDLSGKAIGRYPTPLICQEDGYQINGGNQEGDHCNVDQMTHIHNGGCFYATLDGSIAFVVEPDVQNSYANGCWQWSATGPSSHNQVFLGTGYSSWDQWKNY